MTTENTNRARNFLHIAENRPGEEDFFSIPTLDLRHMEIFYRGGKSRTIKNP